MAEMRVARYDRYGPPEVLYEGRVPVPTVKPGQILVRVRANSVGGGEVVARAGGLRLLTGRRFPKGIGLDFVGQVAVADTGSGLREGDPVWGILPLSAEVRGSEGAAAEYVAVDPARVSTPPANLTPPEAISLMGGGVTSMTALRDKARLKPGERLLVRGGSGGIGSVAVQIGKILGAHVTALAGPKNLDFVRELGADEAFDYTTTHPADLGAFDVVLDTAGYDLPAYRRLLAPGGRLVSITFDRNRMLSSIGYILFSSVYGPRRVRFFAGEPQHALFADIARLAESGRLRPVVDTVHPLADIAAAHRALESGGVRGKHVITLD